MERIQPQFGEKTTPHPRLWLVTAWLVSLTLECHAPSSRHALAVGSSVRRIARTSTHRVSIASRFALTGTPPCGHRVGLVGVCVRAVLCCVMLCCAVARKKDLQTRIGQTVHVACAVCSVLSFRNITTTTTCTARLAHRGCRSLASS